MHSNRRFRVVPHVSKKKVHRLNVELPPKILLSYPTTTFPGGKFTYVWRCFRRSDAIPYLFGSLSWLKKGRCEGQMGSLVIPSRTSDDSATDTASILGVIGDNVSTENV